VSLLPGPLRTDGRVSEIGRSRNTAACPALAGRQPVRQVSLVSITAASIRSRQESDMSQFSAAPTSGKRLGRQLVNGRNRPRAHLASRIVSHAALSIVDGIDDEDRIRRSDVQRPLGTVIVWGLFSSTAATLFLVPVFYRLVAPPLPRAASSDGNEVLAYTPK
jgi:hypothetical protein